MLKKNLMTLFALSLVVLAVPALAQAGDDVDIANDNGLYFVDPGSITQDGPSLDISEGFRDLYNDSVLYTEQGVEVEGQELGSVDYTASGAWAASCDNYL